MVTSALSKKILVFVFCIAICLKAESQGFLSGTTTDSSLLLYPGGRFHRVESFTSSAQHNKPDKVILLIGDGLGVSHITAALAANRGKLYMSLLPYIGLTTTHSANNFNTDSGGGGTALSTGQKTNNYAVGVDINSQPIANLSEILSLNGKSTGVISTSSITHATPACFYAHRPDREMHRLIAEDLANSKIDLFIGGGLDYFKGDSVSANLISKLYNNGFLTDTQTVLKNPVPYLDTVIFHQKFAGIYASKHLVSVDSGRGDFLPVATREAINFLNRNMKGFFLMVEGSQIDWGGHDNDTRNIISETLDFDLAVGEALQFAEEDGRTLVIVTSDHESGGFAVHDGNYASGAVIGEFTSTDHTGSLVPVLAFGPGAYIFSGFYDNTDLFWKILKVMEISF